MLCRCISSSIFFFTLLDKSKIKTVFERSYHHKQQCCIEEKKKMQPYNSDKNNKTELMRYTSIFLTAHSITVKVIAAAVEPVPAGSAG